MTVELETLKNELMQLSVEYRVWLAQSLLESLYEKDDVDLTKLWLDEVRRRDNEIKNGLASCLPADQVLQKIREQLQCSPS